MNEAIKLAWAQGWRPIHPIGQEVLDPLFWQALGKTLGWTDDGKVRIWLYNWHEYIQVLADGGDTEKFWKEILT